MRIGLILLLLSILLNRVSNALPLNTYPDLLACSVFVLATFPGVSLSSIMLIIIGLVLDILNHQILGGRSICLVVIMMFVKFNIDSLNEQKFNVAWGAFSAVFLFCTMISILLNATLQSSISISSMILHDTLRLMLTILVYPLLYKLTLSFRSRYGSLLS